MRNSAFALDKLEFDSLRKALLKEAFTPTGRTLLETLVPSTDPKIVHTRLLRVSEMLALIHASTPPPFEQLKEVEQALNKAKIERFVLDGATLWNIRSWLHSARLLHRFFSINQDINPTLWDMARSMQPDKDLERIIEKTFSEKGEIKPDATPDLARISKKMASRKQAARNVLHRILRTSKEQGMSADDEATIRSGRMLLPVKAEYKRKIKGFIHDVSGTGQTVYIEPLEVFEINNEIRELESEWAREVERICALLTKRVGDQSASLLTNCQLIGQLDMIHASSRLGMRWQGTIPNITNDNTLILRDCRNPLLLLKYHRTDEALSHVVPLNLELSADEKGIIITGPNAGGKSVTLKTVGLALTMAQCGIPIPAEEGATLPVTSGIFIDMGDEQSIESDLSTFSSRLNWMKHTLEHARPFSFVLVDEAGSGTDPDEGTALVTSFLDLLSERNVRSIITTHHGSLKTYAHEKAGWSNASMEFDQKSLSPTYKFKKGIPGSSYAFEIAERLGLPLELTTKARKAVGSGKNKLESLILTLEQESQALQEQITELNKKDKIRDDIKKDLEERLKTIRNERDQIREKALSEAESILAEANQKIEQAIRAASEKDKNALKQKRQEISEFKEGLQKKKSRQKHKQQQKKQTSIARKPEVGDPVRLMDSHSAGELIEIHDNVATVSINGLRVKTKYHNLELTKKSTVKKTSGYTFTSSLRQNDAAQPFSGRLDIRGKRGEEAVREVIPFVDEALRRGIQNITIVHGKGDGILKKLVHEHLQSRNDIKHFEAAPLQEGGDGCTYIYL